MFKLEELYKIKEFQEAMNSLTDEQKQQTEKELEEFIERFNKNIVDPLLKISKTDT